MTDRFVFGALCYRPLLEIVLGGPVTRQPARLPDYSVYALRGGPLDLGALCATPGAAAEGLLLTGLDATQAARLDFHAGGVTPQKVEVVAAEGRTPAEAHVEGCPPQDCRALWDHDGWIADWGSLACATAEAMMLRFGRVDAAEVAGLAPFLAARAWARHLAQHGAPCSLRSDMGRDKVELVRDKPGFEGFFRLRAFDIRHRRFDGTISETIGREGFIAYDAALVLPYDPVTDQVLLIEQLRYGPVLRGDPHPWVLEPVAGLVDAGESPDSCALREAVEEAGLHLRDIRPMARVYASPGYTTEFFHCFLGLADLASYTAGLGGLDSEHEDIRSHVMSFDKAIALVESGEVNVGPLAMMLLWLARERDRLRATA
ncbi:NUDIX domain-containing protein [Salipiger mucosus]|uniref:ADP-ribose pyrophosphatase n=1 Tax=Salipiger mucosus DSM 16094 TaxID=1123237 RepID=S9RWS9_9RHOB|nr:NUDIX domain-containing protein [Salipiger mucosus]EPX78459.1 Tellurite resistance protein TrgB / ADP-ribose pyrophosphatase [Salipiger mucosus DSM 16094]